MQQHSVPQNITGFEFKLIGFLTLRQFGYLAAAAIFAFILYSAKLPIVFVILIAGPPGLLALALAFLPYNGLPFERAAAAFLHTIYSPSIRVWHREPKVLGFLEPQFSIYLHKQNRLEAPRILSDRTKLTKYLASQKKVEKKTLVDINEERRLFQLKFSPLKDEKQVFVAPSPQNIGPDQNDAAEIPHFQRAEDVVQNTIEKVERGLN